MEVGQTGNRSGSGVQIMWAAAILCGGGYGIMQFIVALAQAMVEAFYSPPAGETGVVVFTEWPVTIWCMTGMIISGMSMRNRL